MARKPILHVDEVEVERRRFKGVSNSHFSNGHVCLGEARVCFNCHGVWADLWDLLVRCQPCTTCDFHKRLQNKQVSIPQPEASQ